jgi:hypothetical protein
VFSLHSDELKVTDQQIAGVQEMRRAIEDMFPHKR